MNDAIDAASFKPAVDKVFKFEELKAAYECEWQAMPRWPTADTQTAQTSRMDLCLARSLSRCPRPAATLYTFNFLQSHVCTASFTWRLRALVAPRL